MEAAATLPVDRPWFPHHIGTAMHHNIWTGIATENAPALRARTQVHRVPFNLPLKPHTVEPHRVNTSVAKWRNASPAKTGPLR